MPVMDGLESTEMIRKFEKEQIDGYRASYIVGLTAHANE